MHRSLHLTGLIWLVALLLSACASSLATPIDRKTPLANLPITATPAEETPAPPAAVLAAQTSLANMLGLPDTQTIVLLSLQPVNWSDTCLETSPQSGACDPANIPGYRVLLTVNGQLYEMHTNSEGSLVLPTNTSPTAIISLIAEQRLAEALNRPLSDLRLISIAPVLWSNTCLGMPETGSNCSVQTTPGYRVLIEIDNLRYELHTNSDGSQVSAAAPQPGIGLPQLSWQGGAPCQTLEMSVLGLSLGDCDGVLMTYSFPTPDLPAQLFEWITAYGPFIAQTPAGSVQLLGNGQQAASPSQQRAVAEWAAWVAHNAPGQGDPTFGLAFEWRRSGGIGGVCETLQVMRSGLMTGSTCDGEIIGQALLSDEELTQLYAWLDELTAFEQTTSDPATADGFEQHLSFWGNGTQASDAATQTALLEFCARQFDQLRSSSQ